MLRKFTAIIFALSISLTISAAQQRPESVAAQTQIKPREIPPEMSRRIAALQSTLQPSAKAWVEQQAHLESQKQSPDAPAIEAAVYHRFPALNTRGSSAKASDINALVAIVMMQEATDAEKDLQNMMAQMQAINNAKQQIRNLMSQLQSEISSNASQSAKTPCQTALCKSLPSTIGEISSATANLQKPVRISVPAKLTYADLRTLPGQLQSNLDSVNDLSTQQQMKLQMLMDQRSKLLDELSNLMKKMDDTASSILQNIK